MSKLQTIFLSILIVALVAIGGVFAYRSSQKPEAQGESSYKVRIGYTPTTSSLGVFIAQEMGYFTELGLDTSLVEFQSSNLMNEAIIRGDLDTGCCTGIVAPIEINLKTPNKIKLFTVQNDVKKSPWNQLLVKKDSTINTLKDLEGKKIGVFPGSLATPLFRKYLEQNNIDTSKIEITGVVVANQLQMLESGSIDALFAYEPTASVALEKKLVKVIDSGIFSKQNSNASTGAGYISTDFIEKNPTETKKYIAAMDKAHRFIFDSPLEAARLQVKWTKVDLIVAEKAAILDYYPNSEIPVDKFQGYLDFLFEIGVIKQKVEAEDLIYKI